MSQLVLVRCIKCKRRYAQHGDAGCPFCALDGSHTAPPTPKVVVRGDAVAEVVRPQPPPAKPGAGAPAAMGTPSAPDSSLAPAASPGAVPVATVSGPSRTAADKPIVPEKRGAIVLRSSAPVRLGPIVLPRGVWMSIVAVAILVAGSVAAWEVTRGDSSEQAKAVTPPPPSPSDPVADEMEPEAPQAQQQDSTGAPTATGKEGPAAVADPGGTGPVAVPSGRGDASATPAGHFRQGTRYFMDSNLGEAQAQFEAAIALDPGHCAAHRALGVIHATRQDNRRAIESYQRYLQCSPRVADDVEIQRRIAAFGGNAPAVGDGQR